MRDDLLCGPGEILPDSVLDELKKFDAMFLGAIGTLTSGQASNTLSRVPS
jgi:isocitrate/isopropylmalate dehydrogenase